MRFYLAAKYDKQTDLLRIADQLTALGHDVQADWLTGTHTGTSQQEARRYADIDFGDIACCTHFVLFNLPHDQPEPPIGRYIELGYAYRSGKQCIVVGGGESVFYALMTRYATTDAFLASLRIVQEGTDDGF